MEFGRGGGYDAIPPGCSQAQGFTEPPRTRIHRTDEAPLISRRSLLRMAAAAAGAGARGRRSLASQVESACWVVTHPSLHAARKRSSYGCLQDAAGS